MSMQRMPKTLAKTLTYILTVAPGEYGLFWNPDGTMPWKELYWALQEDDSLRYVREMHLREIAFLGIEFPVELEGNLLRLKREIPVPVYPPVDEPPQRLYYACRRKQYLAASRYGFTPSSRPFLPLCSERELALRLGSRRDPEPILVEVFAAQAAAKNIVFLQAGPILFLAKTLPVQYLLFPPVREDFLLKVAEKKKSEKKSDKIHGVPSPGSFLMDINHLQESTAGGASQGGGKKGKRGAEWKRAARKERNKRNV